MSVRVTVIGSADAFNSGGRGNACHLVEDGAGAFCVDFGPTALMGLKARGFEPDRLDLVMLTHLHGDHFGGLHLLLIDAQYRALRSRPLTVLGPVGTRRRIESWYRLAYGSAASKRQFETRYVELAPGQDATVLGRRVRGFPAQHMGPRDGALSLRVRTGGATLAFSGDTSWSEALPALCRGADLLVCDCTEERGSSGQHLSWEVLEPRLTLLAARRILLAHLGPGTRQLASGTGSPRDTRFAEDGDSILLRGRPAARRTTRTRSSS